jgi:putative ABC transport system permease protein
VGTAFAKKFGVKAGDVLNIHANDRTGWRTLKVVGLVSTGGPEDNAVVTPLAVAQTLAGTQGKYRRLYVSALTKPEDAFARKDPKTMTPAEFDTWYCTPYISSIALQISEELKGTDVRVIRRVAEGEGAILTRVRTLLWLVTFAALLAAALAVGASAAASVIERRTEIGLMKALGAGSGLVGMLLAAEQLLVALSAAESATQWESSWRDCWAKRFWIHAGAETLSPVHRTGACLAHHAARKRLSAAPRFAV